MSGTSEEPITFDPATEEWIRETVQEFEETLQRMLRKDVEEGVVKYELRLRRALLEKRFDVQYSTGSAGGD